MPEKRWDTPRLIILRRGNSSEAILAGCKSSSEEGPQTIGANCCAESDMPGSSRPCKICHGVDCS